MELPDSIPKELAQFCLVALFSLLIGLSQRKVHPVSDESRLFGTDRTFTFIGILGYILYISDPDGHVAFLTGLCVVASFLLVSYINKIIHFRDFGITTIVVAMITYCLAPLIITQPNWLFLLIVVTVLIFSELKESFYHISTHFSKDEFVTLGMFLVIAGVILPIVPDRPVAEGLALHPYRIWLALVVISGISYLSYLLRKFVFHKSGILVSAILGGLYSSTATTIILARKSKEDTPHRLEYAAGILFSIAMMYVRILILVYIFNADLGRVLMPSLLVLALLSSAAGIYLTFLHKQSGELSEGSIGSEKNPLEFKVALIFALLYVVFSLITDYTLRQYGESGLTVLSVFVGFTDIDPFLLNLFQGKYDVTASLLATAALTAIVSNNVVKLVYACSLAPRKLWRYLIASILAVTVVNVIFIFLA